MTLAWFALLYGWAAFSFSEPGILTTSPYCPPPVLVGVDFYPHYIAGHALWRGLSPYDNLRHHGGPFVDPVPDHPGLTSRFTYPPPVAYLFAPLSLLPAPVAWKVRLAASVAGMTLALALLVRLAGRDRWFGPVLAGLVLAFYPLHFVTINGNVALVCLILTVFGLYSFLAGGPPWVTAFLLALATVIKLYPGIILLYFLAQRRWGLAWRMTGALALLVVLTARGGLWLAWLERAREFDRFHQAWYLNGSLYSLLVMSGAAAAASNAAAKLFALTALSLALWWTRRQFPDPLLTLYQCGLLCVAVLLAPTTVYDYNLSFVMPVLAAALWDLRRNGFSAPLALLAAGYAGMAVPSSVVGESVAASKFPWLLAFFLAIVWRLRPEKTRQTAAAVLAG